MSDAMIETKDLTKRYGDVAAVTGLNLSVARGTLFGFIGPNGAGKSTAIRILCGLLKPTSGAAAIDGVDVTRRARRIKSTVGYMAEDFGVYERMRVGEYLDFFAAAHRLPMRARKKSIDKALDLAGAASMRDYFMGTLSRGMKQRAGIARALVHDPAVLILDEPTSGLDPYARIEIRALLRQLKDTGKTILISSHILPELASVCDAVGIISEGRLLAAGPVADIMSRARQELKIEIEFLGRAEPAAELIGRVKGASDVAVTDNALRFTYNGPLKRLPELQRVLAERGHKVLWVREMEADLEHAFIRITSSTEKEKTSVSGI